MIPAYVLAETGITHCHKILYVPSEPTYSTTSFIFRKVGIEKCFEFGGGLHEFRFMDTKNIAYSPQVETRWPVGTI